MFHLVTIPPRVMHGQEHARCCAALLNARPMGFYAAARIVRDACDHGVDTSYYNWCKIAQIAATENSDPHVDPYMSCEKVPGFNLEYKLMTAVVVPRRKSTEYSECLEDDRATLSEYRLKANLRQLKDRSRKRVGRRHRPAPSRGPREQSYHSCASLSQSQREEVACHCDFSGATRPN